MEREAIPMSVPTVLFYRLDGERGARIRTLCVMQRLRVRAVAPEEYGEPIAALAGLAPLAGEAAPGEGFTDEMLVFCGLSDAQLDRFLRDFRRAGLAPVALKAVLTPDNARWSSVRLREELSREHEAMRKQ